MKVVFNIIKFLLSLVCMALGTSFILGSLAYLMLQLYKIVDAAVWGYTTELNLIATAVFAIITIVIGKLVSKNLNKHVSGKWPRRELKGVYNLLAVAFVFGFFVLSGIGTMFSGGKEIYKKPKDCENENISNVTECSGYGQFGFQNNYNYDIRAYGAADQKLCSVYQSADFSKSFMSDIETPDDISKAFRFNSDDGHSCDLNSPETSWIPVACTFTKHSDIQNCYQCAKGLTNGNGHRYVQIGFADDCSTGAYIFLAGWKTKLIEKVKKLGTKQDSQNPPHLKGFRLGF